MSGDGEGGRRPVGPSSHRTRLDEAVDARRAEHPDADGILAIADPRESFAARAVLARAAGRTLDAQYYIWHDDTTGNLLLLALREAAERGVRVRLLLDDNGIAMDDVLVALDEHANIEVRVFNPFPIRTLKRASYAWDFERLNRRMHNKSFTADGRASVVGGRNVGDDYFGATAGMLFSDLDALLVGPVVDEVCADFERYWTCESARPAADVLKPVDADRRAKVLAGVESATGAPEAGRYLDAISTASYVTAPDERAQDFVWADVRLVSDDPSKALGDASDDALLIARLDEVLSTPRRSLALVSAYFVPGEKGTRAFADLARRGVRVSVLTNALESTDVVAVHAGYAKRRKPLLAAGVRLFEMQRLADDRRDGAGTGPFGSSGSSLHAKTFAVDGQRAFIGSFNLDPRSIRLNTELGFVIESPALARRIEGAFDEGVPARAYEVRLDGDGDLYWVDRRGGADGPGSSDGPGGDDPGAGDRGEPVRLDREPGAGPVKRLFVAALALLPLEWLL